MNNLRIRSIYIVHCLAMFLLSCNENEPTEKNKTVHSPFGLTKYVTIAPNKSFFKAIYINTQSVKMHVTAKADSMEYFDFNVMDKDSYQNYKPGTDLKFFYKLQDRKSIDTIITLNMGSYLFAFENFKNTSPINVHIKLKKID